MKTKGNWVIKTTQSALYWCGNNFFDGQLRKAQIYHWKEAAEDQVARLKQKDKSLATVTFEVIEVSEPKELKDTEAQWKFKEALDEDEYDYICSNCGYCALNDYRGNPVDSRFCPNCGKRMINSTMPEDDE
jgi:rubrerythrin